VGLLIKSLWGLLNSPLDLGNVPGTCCCSVAWLVEIKSILGKNSRTYTSWESAKLTWSW